MEALLHQNKQIKNLNHRHAEAIKVDQGKGVK